jgi:hypothetical protein
MQTLTAGSFLNLENASTVEALKFTARRLAEHTGSVVKENLPPASLENLARQLWEKAEYVTRETERRRLHQIFVENFSERFRELKPETAEAQKSESGVSPAEATTEIAASEEQATGAASVENGESESATEASENVSSSVSPKETATVAEGKRDEFLGFVESGVSFGDVQSADASAEAAAAMTAPKEDTQTIAQADEIADESSKPEIQSSVENPNPANQNANVAEQTVSPTAEKATVADSAESKPTTTTAVAASAGRNGANTVADGREPFEFEKCTVNLNLTLLPAESGKNARKVILAATSHNLPPEIEFLEINENGDLTQIADLVREKLARFKQTLPVKYIEQLRQSKNKSAKKSAPTKATTAAVAAPTQTAINQIKAEIPSGKQETQEASSNETVKPQTETTAESSIAASTFAPPTVNQSVAANSIQGSLF